jgi:cytoskeletal protein CcmA (bactofilin family)
MSDVKNPMPPREKRTLVEEGTEFQGTLSSRCPIDVMGRVKGDVTGPSIHISSTGVLDGTVKVSELHSEGELAGVVDADRVQLSGRVRDNTVIRASAIEVKLDRNDGKMEMVFGDCQLEIGAQPDKEAAIAAALGGNRVAPTRTPPEQPASTVPALATEAVPIAEDPVVAAPTAPRIDAGSSRGDEATSETKSLPPEEAWNLTTAGGASATAPETAATEADGDRSTGSAGKRERRRRGTLPPPPG